MKPTWSLQDWRLWAAAGMAMMAAAVLICVVWVVPAATSAKAEAASAQAEAAAGRQASEEARLGNEAAACRSTFAGSVADERANLDDARAAHQVAIGNGLQAAVDGDQAAYLQAVVDVDTASASIEAHRVLHAVANDRYQNLLATQRSDQEAFWELCRAGPG